MALAAGLGAGTASAAPAKEPGTSSKTTARGGATVITDSQGQTFTFTDAPTATPATKGKAGAAAKAAVTYTGSFAWTIDFNYAIQSRYYDTRNAGEHKIVIGKGTGCMTQFGAEKFTVRLYKDGTFEGAYTFKCSAGATVKWVNLKAHDDFYFTLSTDYAGYKPNRKVAGTMYYP